MREFVGRVRSCLNAGDTLARWGGEFNVILADGSDVKDAREVVDKLRRRMTEPFAMRDGRAVRISVSTGYAPLGAGTTGHDAWLAAGAMLYASRVPGAVRAIQMVSA